MIKNTPLLKTLFLSLGLTSIAFNPLAAQAEKTDKLNVFGDFRLRYERVQQDNALEDADALTLRSRVGFATPQVSGFSFLAEVENVIEIIDDFSVPPAGVRPGQFSVIADPDGTEVDQAYVKYSANGLTAKVGRQVFTLDGHRFVGHVGWRQDRQTFDGVVVNYKSSDDFTLTASYIDKRNRIFNDEADIDSKDVILNTSYDTSIGKLTGYAYLLEVDNDTDNSIDTYGVSLKGKSKQGDFTYLYHAEYASQEIDDTFDTDYLFLEGGIKFEGITAIVGYEVLGSDDGQRGFATPLATLHKFNGWADVFLGTPSAGLEDLYIKVAGKGLGGKWAAIYHDFSADETVAGSDDLGSEIDLSYARKFGDRYSGGIKFALYSQGDDAFGRVDTDKAWIWLGAKF